MVIGSAAARALDEVAARERDVLQSFTPGASPERSDISKPASVQPALDPLSVAPPAGTYFVVDEGGGRHLFTGDGSFRIVHGTLVDEQGRAVLGYGRAAAPLAPLRVDDVDTALGYTESASIEADGTLTYERPTIDPRTGTRELRRVIAGRIALARFAPGTKLQAVDTQHGAAPAGVAPHIGTPRDGNFAALTQFARAGSGVDLDLGLQRLQEAYIALDAIRAATMAQRGVEKTAMDLLK